VPKVIEQDRFTKGIFEVLDEVFETHHGYFLDRNNSLFDTLAGVDAGEASRPVGGKCASLAAHVAHVTFYLEVYERYMRTKDDGDTDWGAIWRTTEQVTPDEWAALVRQLKETYARVLAMMRGLDSWDDEDFVSASVALVAHASYHLGEMRQALCTLK
jgi:uncharacterized damage-inducible protein DinB